MKPGVSVELNFGKRLVEGATVLPSREGGVFVATGPDGLLVATDSVKLSGDSVRKGINDPIAGYPNMMSHGDLSERAMRECVQPVEGEENTFEAVEGATATFTGTEEGVEYVIEGPFREV